MLKKIVTTMYFNNYRKLFTLNNNYIFFSIFHIRLQIGSLNNRLDYEEAQATEAVSSPAKIELKKHIEN